MVGSSGWSRTAGDIVAEIEMEATNFSGNFLVVEGISDSCFFSTRICGNVSIIQAEGRSNVEGVMRILDSDPCHAKTVALGLIDEDYDWLTGYVVPSPNIVKFDPRDLEGFLIRSNALDSVLAELGDAAKITSFSASTGMSVRDALLQKAEFFGRVRMFNAVGPNVCLRDFKPQRFCDPSTWSYDYAAALAEAVRLGVHHDASMLQRDISAIVTPSIWHAVRGHDLVDILTGGLLRVLGNSKGNQRVVEMLLRQAAPDHQFRASGFYARLLGWQALSGAQFVN